MHGTISRSHKMEPRVWSPLKPTDACRPKVVNFALQGGGSHGAFTWGVLDRLLEEKQLIIEGITATIDHRGHYRDQCRRCKCSTTRLRFGNRRE
jgi:hypothetical protein